MVPCRLVIRSADLRSRGTSRRCDSTTRRSIGFTKRRHARDLALRPRRARLARSASRTVPRHVRRRACSSAVVVSTVAIDARQLGLGVHGLDAVVAHEARAARPRVCCRRHLLVVERSTLQVSHRRWRATRPAGRRSPTRGPTHSGRRQPKPVDRSGVTRALAQQPRQDACRARRRASPRASEHIRSGTRRSRARPRFTTLPRLKSGPQHTVDT